MWQSFLYLEPAAKMASKMWKVIERGTRETRKPEKENGGSLKSCLWRMVFKVWWSDEVISRRWGCKGGELVKFESRKKRCSMLSVYKAKCIFPYFWKFTKIRIFRIYWCNLLEMIVQTFPFSYETEKNSIVVYFYLRSLHSCIQNVLHQGRTQDWF